MNSNARHVLLGKVKVIVFAVYTYMAKFLDQVHDYRTGDARNCLIYIRKIHPAVKQ